MAAGDGFTRAQRAEIDRAIRSAETSSRLEFSVYVGESQAPARAFAERLHAGLSAPARTVLVMVDPAARVLEIVTGTQARTVLADSRAALAAETMQSAFAQGDLVGGLIAGITQLAESGRAPRVLHAESAEQ